MEHKIEDLEMIVVSLKVWFVFYLYISYVVDLASFFISSYCLYFSGPEIGPTPNWIKATHKAYY